MLNCEDDDDCGMFFLCGGAMEENVAAEKVCGRRDGAKKRKGHY